MSLMPTLLHSNVRINFLITKNLFYTTYLTKTNVQGNKTNTANYGKGNRRTNRLARDTTL